MVCGIAVDAVVDHPRDSHEQDSVSAEPGELAADDDDVGGDCIWVLAAVLQRWG